MEVLICSLLMCKLTCVMRCEASFHTLPYHLSACFVEVSVKVLGSFCNQIVSILTVEFLKLFVCFG